MVAETICITKEEYSSLKKKAEVDEELLQDLRRKHAVRAGEALAENRLCAIALRSRVRIVGVNEDIGVEKDTRAHSRPS